MAEPACQCDDGTWDYTPGPICESYQGDGGRYCSRCEHDEACHELQEDGKDA